ncbi:MAG: N-acetylmuramoyl-L-alanine amidase [Actinobacteria bacterium]|nr:N-acetylmuramoyl-L-alanine amidase [Actinomycetota bacterium]
MKKILICAVLAAMACLAAAGAPPRTTAAAELKQAPPVHLRVVRLAGALPVAPEVPATTRAQAREGRHIGHTAAHPGAALTLDAGMQFTMAGVICGVPSARGAVLLRLRTSLDGRSWSPWYEAPLELAGEAEGPARAFTEPVWTGAARYLQVAAVAGGAASPALLENVRLVALDPTEDADSPDRSAAPGKAAGAPQIVTRRQWGADESLRDGRPDYAKVKMAFVHHTASGNTYTAAEAPAVMRAIYAYHTRSLGWSDIGYNFLIDRFGTIYEGRYGGMKRGVVGAQVLGFNTGSTGISVIGNFAADAPPAAALAALEKLLTWKLKIHHLYPRGTARLTCDYSEKYARGARVTFPVIAGHRQANHTECPGNILYPLLPTVRLEAAGRPQAPIIALVKATPERFSPNGDGAVDDTVLSLSLTKDASWSVELRDVGGTRLGSYSGEGAFAEVTWPGTDADGHQYADGVYTAVVAASAALGNATPKAVKVIIDTVAPELTEAGIRPGVFSPNGDGYDDTAKVRYVPSENCAIRVAIIDADGQVRRRLTDWHSQSVAAHSAVWDGQVADGGKLVAAAEGEYKFSIECRDAAGNVSRRGVKIALDRTLGFPTAVPQTFSPNGDGVSDSTMLGFTLTRSAAVGLVVKVDGKTVRAFELGSLDAGPHSAVWDGAGGAGEPLGSSRPSFSVTAESSLGASSVGGELVIDLYRPRLSAAAAQTVSLGSAARLGCTAQDSFSATVDLSYTIIDAAGATVAAASRGQVVTGTAITWTWKPPAVGVYTVTYTATDLGGNREQATAVTVLTVR